jgi:lysozyme family protein
MAQFEVAYAKTSRNEGGYANNLKDRGGETFHGIARKFWPMWTGWVLIDAERSKFPSDIHNSKNWKQVDKVLESVPRLKELVRSFYKANFWDDIEGDRINSQEVANTLYDWAVNSGEGSPAKAIQRIVGATPDGDIGPATAAKINAYVNQASLPGMLREKRVQLVKEIVKNDPSQSVFLDNWVSRAQVA